MDVIAVLHCPAWGHAERLTMPTIACVVVLECTRCHTRITPNSGDCVVFCSFWSVPCPPVQLAATYCTPEH